MEFRLPPVRLFPLLLVLGVLCGASVPSWAVQWRPLTAADLAGTPLASQQSLNVRAKVAPAGTRFEYRRRLSAPKGAEHWRYQQSWQGLPIWGEYIDVHRRSGQGDYVRGRVAIDMPVAPLSAVPVMTGKAILRLLQDDFSASQGNVKMRWRYSQERADPVWYIAGENATRAYAVYFRADADGQIPVRFNAIVDAANGNVLKKWNSLTHADAHGPGGNEKTGRYVFGTDLPALDVTQEGDQCVMSNANVTTINLNHGYEGSPHRFDCPENTFKEINGAYSPLNDAHFFGNATYRMFQEWLGVAPLGFPLTLQVHYSTAYENAFWDGATMTFGDGEFTFYPLVDANVVSHEVAHGFTEQNSGLVYQGQSGGINEAYSDMAGEALEQFVFGEVDWQVGAGIFKDPAGALRYFEQPSLDGASIDHASGYYDGMDVHYSSGVFNRAFYLLANTSGWNVRQAFTVFSHANRYYWQPTADFMSAACDTILSANDLGLAWQAVHEAFATVGVSCVDLPIDSDEDGMPDTWETLYRLDPDNPSDHALDGDNDNLSNLDEYLHRTYPNDADSDDDSLQDGAEIATHGTAPNDADSDDDRMPDGWEINNGLNAVDAADAQGDADADGASNVVEYLLNTNPQDANSRPVPSFGYHENFESGSAEGWAPLPGQAGWYVSDDFAAEGAHSLRSAVVDYGLTSSMEWTQYTINGVLQFNAGVNSSSGYAMLRVYLDDVLHVAIEGTQQQRYRIELPHGLHTLRVEYTSDAIIKSAANAAWIDDVEFVGYRDTDGDGLYDGWELANGLNPDNAADAAQDFDGDGLSNLDEFHRNTEVNNPDTDDDALNDGAEIALGTDPLHSDSDHDGMPDGWEARYGLLPTTYDGYDDFDADGIANIDEYLFGSIPNDAASRPTPTTDYFESFENGTAPRWLATEGVVPWSVDSRMASEGRFALTSGAIDHWQTSEMRLMLFTGEGILDIDVGVDSEHGYDYLTVWVDNEEVARMSGAQVSQRITRMLGAGRHEVRVQYAKDISVASGMDAGWIDNIRFRPMIDNDHDGIFDEWETQYGLNPNDPADAQADLDGDGLSNYGEYQRRTLPNNADTDGDSVFDGEEVNRGINPLDQDSDHDYMSDGWEIEHQLNPLDAYDAWQDADQDGLINLEEMDYRTDPLLADTDGDRLSDFFEIYNGLNPLDVDSDDDRMPDGWEIDYGLLAYAYDFDDDIDADGFSNGQEYWLGSVPNDANSVPQPVDAFNESFESGAPGKWLESTGLTPWTVVREFASHGQSSLRSGLIADNGTSEMNLMLYTHAGRLILDVGMDTELGNDQFFLVVDDEIKQTLSGTRVTRLEVSLSEGIHQITLRYVKNGETSYGKDLVWIDNVRFLSSAMDKDDDRLPDSWEVEHGLNPADPGDALADSDGDGLNNLMEYDRGTHPQRADSDADGLPDGVEIDNGLNPLAPEDASTDLDGDGVSNLDEYRRGTSITVPDRNLNGGGNNVAAKGGKGGGGSTGGLLLLMLAALWVGRNRMPRAQQHR